MDFNIRAISLADCVTADARIAVCELLGEVIEFRAGISIRVALPDTSEQFGALPEPERLLTALKGWARVYRYPQRGHQSIHIIAAAESGEEEVLFYRIDLNQPPPSTRRGLRPPVEIVTGAVMSYDHCAAWLVELSHGLAANPNEAQRPVILARPRLLKSKQVRVAWVGPEILDGQAMPLRLAAIGQVYGAEIVHVAPRTYQDVKARLAGALPLDATIICSNFAPYIGAEAVPDTVRRDLIHICDGTNRDEIEDQMRTWIENAAQTIENESRERTAGEQQVLLAVMLRGMLSHSKIGQFNHCQKATVLTGVRARHMNAALAERLLNEHSELFQETKNSNKLFLWKDHNDGRQYFLNPHRVEEARVMVAQISLR